MPIPSFLPSSQFDVTSLPTFGVSVKVSGFLLTFIFSWFGSLSFECYFTLQLLLSSLSISSLSAKDPSKRLVSETSNSFKKLSLNNLFCVESGTSWSIFFDVILMNWASSSTL